MSDDPCPSCRHTQCSCSCATCAAAALTEREPCDCYSCRMHRATPEEQRKIFDEAISHGPRWSKLL